MSRDDFMTAKVRKTTHTTLNAFKREHRTSSATLIEAAVQRFVKLPRSTILRDIERYDPRGGSAATEAAPAA